MHGTTGWLYIWVHALQVTNARFKNVKSIAGSDCELLSWSRAVCPALYADADLYLYAAVFHAQLL